MTKKQKEYKNITDVMRYRTQDEWRELIMLLPKHLQPSVARIIWWDWYSHRTVANRWENLDDLINVPVVQLLWERANPDKVAHTDENEIFQALILLGYPLNMASDRL